LFAETFPTDDGRARFHASKHVDRVEQVSEEFPFYLITGRLLAHYQTGTQTHRVPTLERAEPEPFAQMHPQLAAIHRLRDGDWVALSTRRGRALFRVKLSAALRLDTVFVPFHWSGSARANTLTSSTLDPRSKIPEFKLSAVALERIDVHSAGPKHTLPIVSNKEGQ
jgi:assimilatory nitrate reductase catalytic subunit